MRKFVIGTYLTLVLIGTYLLLPSPSHALCNQPVTCPIPPRVQCLSNPTWCCDTIAECLALPTLTPTPTPPSGPPFASPTPTPISCGNYRQPCCAGSTCSSGSGLICDSSNTCIQSCSAAGGRCGTLAGFCQPGEEEIGQRDCAPNYCCRASPSTGSGSSASEGCPSTNYVNTAFGCLDITGRATIETLLRWATGIAGGIALAVLGYAGFIITTATGDPKRVQAGRELVTSAFAGIFLIATAVVLLNFIGVDVLGLGSLGFRN